MHKELNTLLGALAEVVLGKPLQVRLALTCMLAKGHLLIEDLPGMGKTTLAHALAKSLGLEYQRVQFTSDLLPADVLGMNVFDRDSGEFRFHPGPIFTQLLLADEINRCTPRTQSALLEAMEERQVSIEGCTRELPRPFFVIATQNPQSQTGTYALPESQLDRFLMRIHLGYPTAAAERELLKGADPRQRLLNFTAALDAQRLAQMQDEVGRVHSSDAVLDYVQRLVSYSRNSELLPIGLSPRGALALLQAARAWAYIDGRQHVLPEDVQAVLVPVVAHRLRGHSELGDDSGEALALRMLNEVEAL